MSCPLSSIDSFRVTFGSLDVILPLCHTPFQCFHGLWGYRGGGGGGKGVRDVFGGWGGFGGGGGGGGTGDVYRFVAEWLCMYSCTFTIVVCSWSHPWPVGSN